MHLAHHHNDTSTVDRSVSTHRLAWAVAINLLLTGAQVVGGVLAGSLALVADALHNFSDAAGLLLALIVDRIARRDADERRTFGYARARVIGGLINLTAVMVAALYLLVEAAMRLFEPREVDGWVVIAVAGVALVIDLATAALTYSISKGDMNLRAAFLHNLADAVASVAVIVSGVLVLVLEWWWMDLVATLVVSAYIAWMSLPPMRRAISLLMQSAPPGIDADAVAATVLSVEGVLGVHHVHLWQIDEGTASLECHVVCESSLTLGELDGIRRSIVGRVRSAHGVGHVTIAFVSRGEAEALIPAEA